MNPGPGMAGGSAPGENALAAREGRRIIRLGYLLGQAADSPLWWFRVIDMKMRQARARHLLHGGDVVDRIFHPEHVFRRWVVKRHGVLRAPGK